MTLLRKLLATNCCECGEIKVWFWNLRCEFCDVGEGKMKQ